MNAPAAELTVLDNGFRVVTVPGGYGSMCAMLFVAAGSRHESRSTSGAAHLLEHLFFSGTPRWPSMRAIAAEIDGWGCRFNALTDKEYTAYFIHGPTERAGDAVAMLAELIHNATLPAGDLERERRVVLAELRTGEDNPRVYCRRLANRALYGDTPMGWDSVGSPEVIRSLGRDDLLAFRTELYVPGQMMLALAGGTDHASNCAAAKEHFLAGDGHQPRRPAAVAYAPLEHVVAHRDIRQSHLCLTIPGPTYRHSEREMFTARFVNTVLGSSMSSRLFTSVRERQGLCYSIRSTLDPASDVGAFVIFTSTEPAKSDQVTGSIVAEMERLAADGPTDAELRKARAITKGTHLLEREDSSVLARLSAFELMQRGRISTREEKFAIVDDISAEEVTAAARHWLVPGELRCALVGPAAAEKVLQAEGSRRAGGSLPAAPWREV